MRYRCPYDCGAVAHDGVALARAADGTFEAAAEAAAALAPHGLVPVEPTMAEPEPPRARVRDDRRMLR